MDGNCLISLIIESQFMVPYISNLDLSILSLIIFAVCFFITTFTSSKRFKTGHTARAVRSEYRKSWAAFMIKNGDHRALLDFLRNKITVSTTLLGGFVIGFGLVVNAFAGTTTVIGGLHLLFIITIMAYAVFYLLIDIRALTYIPIIFGADESLIKKHENLSKGEYTAKLIDNSYDDFASAIRSLFYIIALMVFSFDKLLFIAVTILLTFLFVRRDLSGKSRIEIF